MEHPKPRPPRPQPSPVMLSAPQLPLPSRQPSPVRSIDHDIPSGARTPSIGSGGGFQAATAHRRRITLLSLIDELTQLRDEDEKEKEKEKEQALPVYDEKKDGQLDARVLQDGVEAFKLFERLDRLYAYSSCPAIDSNLVANSRIQKLDDELQSFTNQVRQLGSSVGLLSSAYELRARLTQLLHTFRENASVVFGVEAIPKEKPPQIKRFSTRKRHRPHRLTQKLRPDVEVKSDPEMLPQELDDLAKDLHIFLQCLNQIPEFTDEAVNTTAMSFHGDLKYWASCLSEFKGQFRYPTVCLHVNGITDELGEHLESITEALLTFVAVGVPTIRFTQKHTSVGLQNLSTVATFFSAVTATTLQYSFEDHETHLQKAVNLLWLVSLVFSLASAINSQLAYHWRSAIYRSPRACVPWWVSIWITGTPLAFLIASAIAFSAGLVCFSFSTFPGFIAIVTVVSTSISSFALFAVGSWFAGERYAFSRTKGKRWLADILADAITRTKKYTGWTLLSTQTARLRGPFNRVFGWMTGTAQKARTHVRQLSVSTSGLLGVGNGSDQSLARTDPSFTEPSDTILPLTHGRKFSSSSVGPRSPVALSPTTPTIEENRAYNSVTRPAAGRHASRATSDSGSTDGLASPTSGLSNGPLTDEPISEAMMSPATRKFKAIALNVIKQNRATGVIANAASVNASASSGMTTPAGTGTNGTSKPAHPTPHHSSSLPTPTSAMIGGPFRSRQSTLQPDRQRRPSRLATIVPALTKLRTTQYLNEHGALVRHLQFSPDGKWFATCSWDETAIIWKVGEPFEIHRKLAHPRAHVSQVAWSPDGRWLLTKTIRAIKLWNAETGVCERTIDRKRDIQSITWMPKRAAFVSVEGSRVDIINLTGTVEAEYDLQRFHLHDVTITPDEQRLLAVGRLEQSVDGLNPAKSRKEKRIIVFNLLSEDIENQVPVLHEVRDITLSSNGLVALVSYEHKAPPQLFRIDMIANAARLVLQNTYVPPKAVDFAGPSYLGHFTGTNHHDHLVLCAGKAGEVHIWDRESARLLHSLRAQDQGSDLTCIAWNHASTSLLMFASASHDGTVRIWTAPIPEPPQSSASSTADRNVHRPTSVVQPHPPNHPHLIHLNNTPEIRETAAPPSPFVESPLPMKTSTFESSMASAL